MDDFGNSILIDEDYVYGPELHFEQWVVSTSTYGGLDCDFWGASYTDV